MSTREISSIFVPKESLLTFLCVELDPNGSNTFLINRRLINNLNDKGHHILYVACFFRDEDLVRQILEIKEKGGIEIDVNVRTDLGNTPLLAVKHNKRTFPMTVPREQYKIKERNIFKLLLKAGADINAQNSKLENILLLIVNDKDEELFDLLLERPDINLEALLPLGMLAGVTILFYLISISRYEEALKVLNKGANVNFQTRDFFKETVLIRLLKSQSSEDSRRSLFLAILDIPNLDLTLSDVHGRNALHNAVTWLTNPEEVRILLTTTKEVLGPDIINSRDNKRKTALHMAIEGRNTIVSEMLLEHGADASLADRKGVNALMLAAGEDMYELCKKIIESEGTGIIFDVDISGKNSMYYALKFGSKYKTLELFLTRFGIGDSGITEDELDELLLSKVGLLDVDKCIFLIRYGANPNVVNALGMNPLFICCDDEEYLPSMQFLIKYTDCDLFHENIIGQRAIDYAKTKGATEAVEILEAAMIERQLEM